MTSMQRISLICFCIAVSVATYAQQLSGKDEQFVDSLLNANYKSSKPGAVILIAKNGQPVFRKAYGLANVELNVPNKPEYVFHIGSISKQFTAVCILKLAQDGKLNLQDDIKKYLPNCNTHGKLISIENLLNHTSGIIDFFEKKEYFAQSVLNHSPEELMNFFINDSLAFEPGTDWGYSNSGYVVAGLIVERVSGMLLNEYLKKNIFDPLGMSRTFAGNDDSLIMNAVNGYQILGTEHFKPAQYYNGSIMYGAGGIVSNVDDLLKWDNALYNEKIVKQEWLKKAWKPFVLPNGQTTSYGFGWSVNNFHGIQLVEHAGGISGFASDGIRIPSQQLYLIILSNNPFWQVPLLSSIALHLTGQSLIKVANNRLEEKVLEDYAGVYAINHSFYAISPNSSEQIYQYFSIQGDTLFSQIQGYSKTPLMNMSKDIFVVPVNGLQFYYEFHRNENGKVISVELYSEPFQTGPHEIQLKTNIPLPKEKHVIKLDTKIIDPLKGKYDFGGGVVLPVIVEGSRIFVQTDEKLEIFAEDETNFFSKTTDLEIKFIKENGKVSGMIIKTKGQTMQIKKIE
jgi:CubicO group peptidase (beta-lactamase class C family)